MGLNEVLFIAKYNKMQIIFYHKYLFYYYLNSARKFRNEYSNNKRSGSNPIELVMVI